MSNAATQQRKSASPPFGQSPAAVTGEKNGRDAAEADYQSAAG